MEPKQTKIGIETTDAETGNVDAEFPWADHLGGDRYQLKNFPFYAYGVSFDDVVEAQLKYDDDPYPYLIKVLEKSGHRTLRILLDESVKKSKRSVDILEHLASMDCGYEGMGGEKYFVINVQPKCDFDAVRDYLNAENIQWEYADPTYDQIHEQNT